MSHHPPNETPVTTERLPGIGRSYELTDLDGDRVSVVLHRGGGRNLFIWSRGDPEPTAVTALNETQARLLALILSGRYDLPAVEVTSPKASDNDGLLSHAGDPAAPSIRQAHAEGTRRRSLPRRTPDDPRRRRRTRLEPPRGPGARRRTGGYGGRAAACSSSPSPCSSSPPASPRWHTVNQKSLRTSAATSRRPPGQAPDRQQSLNLACACRRSDVQPGSEHLGHSGGGEEPRLGPPRLPARPLAARALEVCRASPRPRAEHATCSEAVWWMPSATPGTTRRRRTRAARRSRSENGHALGAAEHERPGRHGRITRREHHPWLHPTALPVRGAALDPPLRGRS